MDATDGGWGVSVCCCSDGPSSNADLKQLVSTDWLANHCEEQFIGGGGHLCHITSSSSILPAGLEQSARAQERLGLG